MEINSLNQMPLWKKLGTHHRICQLPLAWLRKLPVLQKCLRKRKHQEDVANSISPR